MKYSVILTLLLISTFIFVTFYEKDSSSIEAQSENIDGSSTLDNQAKSDNIGFYLLEDNNGIKVFHKFFGNYKEKIGLLDKGYITKQENKLVFYTWDKEHIGKEITIELSKDEKTKKFRSKISDYNGKIGIEKPKNIPLTNNKTQNINKDINKKFSTSPLGRVELQHNFPEEGNWVVDITINKKQLTSFQLKVNNKNEYRLEKLHG